MPTSSPAPSWSGLAAAQLQAEAVGGLEGVLGVEGAEFGAAQAAGEAEEEESAVALADEGGGRGGDEEAAELGGDAPAWGGGRERLS